MKNNGKKCFFTDDNGSQQDYKPIDVTTGAFVRPGAGANMASLYNGNIAGMSVSIAALQKGGAGTNAEPLFYQYRYDQLNRLKTMQAFNGLSSNSWTPVAIDDHKESVVYDPNGNILSYHRKGAPRAGKATEMDQLKYGNVSDYLLSLVNLKRIDFQAVFYKLIRPFSEIYSLVYFFKAPFRGLFYYSCIKLSAEMNCKYCKAICKKAGRQKNGRQKYCCKGCGRYQQLSYSYNAYQYDLRRWVCGLVCNGVGLRGIARVMNVSVNTIAKAILALAKQITKPPTPLNRNEFEMDELRTYIGRKENQYWVAYALCSETRQVIDFIVGKRSKRTLRKVVDTLLLSGVKMIKTDRLNIYQSLIPSDRHIANAYNINHIERNNLNLRTHLKRLSRRTICFSRSFVMLNACLRIYFWSGCSVQQSIYE